MNIVFSGSATTIDAINLHWVIVTKSVGFFYRDFIHILPQRLADRLSDLPILQPVTTFAKPWFLTDTSFIGIKTVLEVELWSENKQF